MRLGEIGEQTADEVRRVLAGELDRSASEFDRFEVFASTTPDPCEVAEHHRVDVGRPSASLTARAVS
jgi:hypothetical protein